MPRFLIELPHDPESLACARFVKLMLTSGSHFLTHADWGCTDGVHKGWVIVDVDTKEEARGILPPNLRAQAHIVLLNKFGLEEIEGLIRHHKREG